MSLLLRLTKILPKSLLRWIALQQHRHPRLKGLYRRIAGSAKTSVSAIQSGPGQGLRFYLGHGTLSFLLGTAEPQIQALLPKICAPGQTTYDVGGNIGFFTVLLARFVGTTGRVFAFEPMPDNLHVLARNVELNRLANVQVVPRAVSSAPATLCMEAAERYDSTYAVTSRAGDDAAPGTTIEVEGVSLDAFVLDEGHPAPDLIKIDVEGHEEHVLEGMRALAGAYGPLILCEVHGTNARVSSLLEEFGYWQAVIEEPGRPLAEAHWNVHVLAGPPSKRAILDRLTEEGLAC